MHAVREHGYKKKVRYYAVGNTCQVCGQCFHTRKRLSVHYEKQGRCYDVVQACWPPLPEEEVAALDDIDREDETTLRRQGWWASKAFHPVLQTFGPALPPADSEEATLMHAKMHSRRPNDATAYSFLQGTKITAIPPDTSRLWWNHNDLPAFVLHSVQGRDAAGGALDMHGLAYQTALLHIRSLVIVHFFSGYRRMGDIHHIVEHRTVESGEHIFTISVDLCMQREKGDLATPQASKWWRERIYSGQVAAAGGGPPCETFTVARQFDGGPRPLRRRSASQPFGIPGLTQREWNQLCVSDRLLRFLLDILVALALMGMSGFLEHPQFPLWNVRGEPASIWTFDAIRYLKNLSCFTVVSFDQCVVGAAGRKPTTLLLLRMMKVREQLLKRGHGGRCHHPPGTHTALIGRDTEGTFHTAKAKVYPYGLNRILGDALFQAATQWTKLAVTQELPMEFHAYLEQSCHDSTVIQPDYHGGTG